MERVKTARLRRRAVLATAAAAVAAAGAVRLDALHRVEAAPDLQPLLINKGDTGVSNNTATGRTNLRADRASTFTFTVQNIGTSTTATRGTLYAYLGNNSTLPQTEETSAIRGLNETADPGGSGISGEGPRGVFGESNHPDPLQARGVVGTADSGIGVEGFSSTGTGVHGFAGDFGGVGVLAEGTGGAAALVAAGRADFHERVSIEGGLQVGGTAVSPDEAVLHVPGLTQGVGVLVARSTDAGVTPPTGGFSDGFAGIMVDLVSEDISLPAGAGLSVATGAETAAVFSSAGGTALEVRGPSLFDGPSQFLGDLNARRFGGTGGVAPVFQNAGTALIPAGKSAVRITNASVKPGTNVIATLQGNAGADVVLKHVSVLNGRFNVVLNKKAARPAKIAYFVLGAP